MTPRTGTDSEHGEIVAELARHEHAVLNLLLAHRRTAAPIASAAGLNVSHFGQDDHRLIFAGWLIACEDDLSLARTLILIRRALRAENLWEPDAPFGSTGMRHSDATLADLAAASMTAEEIADVVGTGSGDGLRRAITRRVVALVDAAEAMSEVRE